MKANLLIPVMGALDRGNVQSEVNVKDHGWEFMEDGGIWAKGVTTDTNALDISSAYRNQPNSGGRLQVQCQSSQWMLGGMLQLTGAITS